MESSIQPTSLQIKVADMRRGANWFFWIAALAAINSLVVTFASLPDSLFGLGATRMVDEAFRAHSLAPIDPAGLVFSIAIAGVFALFGYLARGGNDRIFVVGIFLYAIDAIITIGFRDLFAFGFHLVALFYLSKGLLASRKRFDPSV
ncbi:MAG TPA: hypothetical protein PKD24_14080 [Pyrinomonadaceae bacterium]|nr:hypothetical protein [Pyrinomonadaceae bacterium]HMP66035.1 hypothetical protein [Pyrinomonadaceae bacterium]